MIERPRELAEVATRWDSMQEDSCITTKSPTDMLVKLNTDTLPARPDLGLKVGKETMVSSFPGMGVTVPP